MVGPEIEPGFGGEEIPDKERYSPERAQEEASQIRGKVESGEAKDYAEAEKLIEKAVEGLEGEKNRAL